ncbi:hypothetical protein GLYMA_03G147100v4 [Glycine max]|nr:hypothetical protein GLYMA_03G147100v4 [Glycine max]KAH1070055.1 hypothetical protein GYH30_007256 [Glycine max]
MKEKKNTASTLKRILVNCSSQAKAYGSCVAAKVPDIERDMCVKEFEALKSSKKEGLSELALVFLFWELLKKQTRKLDGYE